MKSIYLVSFILVSMLVSLGCENGNNNVVNKTGNDSLTEVRLSKEKLVDSCGVQTVKHFLLWYKGKLKDLDTIQLVFWGDSIKRVPYRVNFENTERYISGLATSGLLSAIYLQHFRDYFKKADGELAASKQDDGPPEGLDYDLILFTQEPESYLNETDKWSLKAVNANSVIWEMYGSKLEFTLAKEAGVCVISEIKRGAD